MSSSTQETETVGSDMVKSEQQSPDTTRSDSSITETSGSSCETSSNTDTADDNEKSSSNDDKATSSKKRDRSGLRKGKWTVSFVWPDLYYCVEMSHADIRTRYIAGRARLSLPKTTVMSRIRCSYLSRALGFIP